MARLQIDLTFQSPRPNEGDSTLEYMKEDSSGRTLSHLTRIEISMEGRTIFSSQDSLQNGDGKGLRIDDYFLDPADVSLNLTVHSSPNSPCSLEKDSGHRPTEGISTEDCVPSFPTLESENEEDSQKGSMTTATRTGEEDAVGDSLTDLVVLESSGEEKKSGSAPEIYNLQSSTLLAKLRKWNRRSSAGGHPSQKRKYETGLQTCPRYLCRAGADLKTEYQMPLAWPPMTNYKCAITFVEMNREFRSGCTCHVFLMDGDDKVGMVYEDVHEFPTSSYQCNMIGHLVSHLKRAKEWLMHRPLILLSDIESPCLPEYLGYRSLDDFIAKELSEYKNDIHLLIGPSIGTMMKSLLFDD